MFFALIIVQGTFSWIQLYISLGRGGIFWWQNMCPCKQTLLNNPIS